jgi:hypothetical protein
LYTEFIDWVKFLLLGIGGIFLAVFMWRSEGLWGKIMVIIVMVFIIAGSVIKTYSKYRNKKFEHQRDKILLERMERRIDKLDTNIGEIAIIFQKYLDAFKEEDFK